MSGFPLVHEDIRDGMECLLENEEILGGNNARLSRPSASPASSALISTPVRKKGKASRSSSSSFGQAPGCGGCVQRRHNLHPHGTICSAADRGGKREGQFLSEEEEDPPSPCITPSSTFQLQRHPSPWNEALDAAHFPDFLPPSSSEDTLRRHRSTASPLHPKRGVSEVRCGIDDEADDEKEGGLPNQFEVKRRLQQTKEPSIAYPERGIADADPHYSERNNLSGRAEIVPRYVGPSSLEAYSAIPSPLHPSGSTPSHHLTDDTSDSLCHGGTILPSPFQQPPQKEQKQTHATEDWKYRNQLNLGYDRMGTLPPGRSLHDHQNTTPAASTMSATMTPPSSSVPPPATAIQSEDITENDVLFGRGGATNAHAGNCKFRALVQQHRPLYLAAKKKEKPQVASQIVQIVRSRRGRFLKKDVMTSTWRDVGDTKAMEKTCQALREQGSGAQQRKKKGSNKTDSSSLLHFSSSPPCSRGGKSSKRRNGLTTPSDADSRLRNHRDVPREAGDESLSKDLATADGSSGGRPFRSSPTFVMPHHHRCSANRNHSLRFAPSRVTTPMAAEVPLSSSSSSCGGKRKHIEEKTTPLANLLTDPCLKE